jgi:hypothetical protein
VISTFTPYYKHLFVLEGPDGIFAAINRTGKWTINWDGLLKVRAMEISVPIAGFCDLLLAARDRFLTEPV